MFRNVGSLARDCFEHRPTAFLPPLERRIAFARNMLFENVPLATLGTQKRYGTYQTHRLHGTHQRTADITSHRRRRLVSGVCVLAKFIKCRLLYTHAMSSENKKTDQDSAVAHTKRMIDAAERTIESLPISYLSTVHRTVGGNDSHVGGYSRHWQERVYNEFQ